MKYPVTYPKPIKRTRCVMCNRAAVTLLCKACRRMLGR